VGASLAIFSLDLLHDDSIIDQTFTTRITLVETLAEQWFGVLVSPKSQGEAWLVIGLARYLSQQCLRRHFGQNDSLFRLKVLTSNLKIKSLCI